MKGGIEVYAPLGDVETGVTGRPISGAGIKPGGGSRYGALWSDAGRDLAKRLEGMRLMVPFDRPLPALDNEDFEGLRVAFCTAGGGLTTIGAGR